MKILFAALIALTSFAALSQQSRPSRSVPSLNQLLSSTPIDPSDVMDVPFGNNTNDWGGVRRFRYDPTSVAATNIANCFATKTGTGRWVADDATQVIQDSRRWTSFYVQQTNHTAALQAAINSRPRVLSLFGPLYVSQLVITNPIIIEGYGVTMYQLTNGVATNMIQVASNTPNVRIKGLTLDAQNSGARGIRVDKNTSGQLLDCKFSHFQEFNTPGKITTVAFYINGGGTEWTVDSCEYSDLTGLPDGGIGTGTGFCHGIYINREFGSASDVATNKPKQINIVRSKFLRILPGEDSDAIRWTDSGWVFDDINVTVDGCYFEDVGKRAFKASGSGGRFINNTITNSFDGSVQATGWVDVGGRKEQYSVASLYGQNLLVANNKYNGGRIRLFFDSTINENSPLPARNEICNNIFVLSTNWGLNGLSVTNVTQGTIFGSIYLSSDVNVHDNYAEVVQFGIQVYSGSTNISIRDNHFVGLATTNNLVEASSTNGWGRGVRLGRYSTNGYPGGAVENTIISGNYFDNFGAAIDLSETKNTFIGMNYTNRLNTPIVINETGPNSTGFWPASMQINGGNYGAITLLRQLELAYENADTYSANTNRRGGMIWDRIDQAPSFWDGAKWSSLQGYTRKYQSGGVTDTTHWYRVATMWDKGYTTRGSAKITIGSGGGLSTASATFHVINNYSDAQILMEKNFALSGAGSGSPIGAVRVVRDTPNEKLHFDFQPAGALNSLIGVEVQPDWTTQAGMEPTNSWQAVQFTDMGTNLTAPETQIGWISNVTQKVFAFNGDQWNWWFGPDKFVLGEAPIFRFVVTNSVPTTAHTPILVNVDGGMNYIMRDATSGVLYASTYLQPYQTMKFGTGLTNVGTNISVSIAAGSNITLTTNGNTITFASTASTSYTFTNGTTNSGGVIYGNYYPGANITFTTNNGAITIASSGGSGGPTNGSAVYVKGTFASAANFIANSELDPTYSGTNVTYSIVNGSITTNKIDSTFYNFINGKQAALTFSTGTTNSGNTITLAVAAGGGIVFTTNAQTITIASSLTFTNGLTNNNGVVTTTLLAGSNVTLSTNSVGQITIASTGGAGGSSVFVNGAFQTAPNFTNNTEHSWSVVGTNVTLSIVNGSITTNKIDSTFYNFINNKQSALTFSTGTTNSAGTVTLAIAPGGGISFTTNAQTVTITSSLVFTNGLTNSAGTVQWAVAAGSNITLSTNAGLITITAAGGGGGGGLGTNIFVNNVLSQPAKLTNSPTVTWTTNSGGDIVATATTGTNLFMQSVLFANGNQVDVSYTNTTETTLLSLRAGDSAVLAANSLTNGSVLKLEASGSLVQNPADWDGGIFKWKIGGLTLSFTISDTQSYDISATNSSWNITAYVTVQSAGASASVVTIGNLEYSYDNLTVGDPAYHGLRARRKQSGTLDTTTSNTIDLTFLNFSGQEISLNAQSVVVSFMNSKSATTLGAITLNSSTTITNIADRGGITWVSTNGTAYPVLVDWNKYLDWFDDCNYSVIPSAGPVTYAANGAGAGQTLQASEADSAGIIRINTGTTSTGDSRYQYGNGATAITFGSSNYSIAEARIRIPTLSSATERFFIRSGFSDAVGTATDGAYFEYTDNANSGNWIGKLLNNTTAATTNLSVGPSANTWTKLKVIVDSSTTNTYFFVDDVLRATLTNAIPMGAGRETGVRCPQIQANGGSTGTGADNLDIDFVHIEQWYYIAR